MNRITSYLLLALFTFATITILHAQQTAVIKEIEIDSKILNQKRPIYIYTPWEYAERNLVSFDVVYVFDAQNREIFDLVHASLNYVFLKKSFIVVGIASPAYEDSEYYRNSDFLPVPINVDIEKYQTDKPNAENFWRYCIDEVMPFVSNNYRTTNVNYLIGHSLSASFVLDKAIHHNEPFKGFISISPNLAYDGERLTQDFLKFDFNKPSENKFLYISQANELETWAKPWGEAYKKVKSFIDTKQSLGKFAIQVHEFPNYNHRSTVIPSMIDGLNLMADFIDKNPYVLKGDVREIMINVKVLNKDDEVFIAGNQESLGNWNPSKVKFNKVSDFERTLKVNVQFPIAFKLTKGSWQMEGLTDQTTSIMENVVINNLQSSTINLRILEWLE
jgi:predicted alpha/beta superfamily hydrolase